MLQFKVLVVIVVIKKNRNELANLLFLGNNKFAE